jgi:5-hydroxyisourate hydrolase
MTLSTHVLDIGVGEPVSGVRVRLQRQHGDDWVELATGVTGVDGRLTEWVPVGLWQAGTFRLVFATAAHSAFFPEITVGFVLTEPQRHHHIPLLLSPFGYTTYRGS